MLELTLAEETIATLAHTAGHAVAKAWIRAAICYVKKRFENTAFNSFVAKFEEIGQLTGEQEINEKGALIYRSLHTYANHILAEINEMGQREKAVIGALNWAHKKILNIPGTT